MANRQQLMKKTGLRPVFYDNTSVHELALMAAWQDPALTPLDEPSNHTAWRAQ